MEVKTNKSGQLGNNFFPRFVLPCIRIRHVRHSVQRFRLRFLCRARIGFKDKAGGLRIAEIGTPVRGADKAQERDSRAPIYRERGRDSISHPPDPRSCERCLRVVVSIHSWLQASLPIILYILDSRIMSSCPRAREDAQSPTQLEFIPSSADPLVKLSSRLGIVPVSSSLDLGVS